MRLKFILPAMAALAVMPAQGTYIFNTRFNSGRVPAVMTAVDNDGEPLSQADYRIGYTTDGWTVAMVTGGQYAALSPSHSHTMNPQSNLLSCPALVISGQRPMLRWNGRSIHPAFPEAYRVLVQETGSETPQVVFEIAAEEDQWRTRAVDLSPWIGKEVVISFECVSVNKYMLAIDDLYIGDPEEVNYKGVVTSPEYVGLAWGYPGQDEGYAAVTGIVENMGMPLASGRLVCMSDGQEVASEPIADFLCGDALDYRFDIPVSLDKATPYTIEVEDADGQRTVVVDNRVFCSHFPRTLLLDEFTGLWCNNCTSGMLEVERMERRFGSQLVSLTLHVNDELECAEYRQGTSVFNVPWMMLNRNSDVAGESTSRFEPELDAPTVAHIEISGYEISGSQLLAQAKVTWATDLVNSGDRYRVGYVLTHDVVTDEPVTSMAQSNGIGTVQGERFYYLPSKVRSDLSPNRNVVVSGEHAHQGRPYTLPAEMKAMEPFTAEWSMFKPEALSDLSDAHLVAYVVDSANGRVLNACVQDLDAEVVSVCPPAVDVDDAGMPAEYYTLDGIRVDKPGRGLHIERKGSRVRKVIF